MEACLRSRRNRTVLGPGPGDNLLRARRERATDASLLRLLRSLGCPPDVTISWTGDLTLGVESGGDGIYRGGSVALVTLTSDFISFATDGNGAGGAGTVVGDEPGFTVGIQNGSVTFIEGQYWLDPKLDTGAMFTGLSVNDTSSIHLALVQIGSVTPPFP